MKHKIRKKSRLYADNSYYVQRKKKDTAMFDVEDSPELRHSQGTGTQCWGFRASLLVFFLCDYFISLM